MAFGVSRRAERIGDGLGDEPCFQLAARDDARAGDICILHRSVNYLLSDLFASRRGATVALGDAPRRRRRAVDFALWMSYCVGGLRKKRHSIKPGKVEKGTPPLAFLHNTATFLTNAGEC